MNIQIIEHITRPMALLKDCNRYAVLYDEISTLLASKLECELSNDIDVALGRPYDVSIAFNIESHIQTLPLEVRLLNSISVALNNNVDCSVVENIDCATLCSIETAIDNAVECGLYNELRIPVCARYSYHWWEWVLDDIYFTEDGIEIDYERVARYPYDPIVNARITTKYIPFSRRR